MEGAICDVLSGGVSGGIHGICRVSWVCLHCVEAGCALMACMLETDFD